MPALLESFANLASGTVSSGGTTSGSGTETWTVAVTTAFPALSGSQHFYAADQALPGEVFEVTACPGSTGTQSWTVIRGADGTTPVAHTAGFTVVQVAAKGTFSALQADPWVFYPETRGAKGDAQQFNHAGAMTASAATLTDSTNSPFTSADVGKHIVVSGAGASGADLITTISGFTSASAVTLTAAAGTTVTTAEYIYGTDDTQAVGNTMIAADAVMVTTGRATIKFRNAAYFIAGASWVNSTILPLFTNAKLAVLELAGAGRTGSQPTKGTVLFFSDRTGGLRTMGVDTGSSTVTGAQFNLLGNGNWTVKIRDLCVRQTNSPVNHGIDLGSAAAMELDNVMCDTLSLPWGGPGYTGYGTVTPTTPSGSSAGIISPGTNNNGWVWATNTGVSGYPVGYAISEHFAGGLISVNYCNKGVWFLNTVHGSAILYLTCEQNVNHIAGGTAGGNATLTVSYADFESTGNTNYVTDANNTLQGTITWNNTAGAGFSATGGANLHWVPLKHPAGVIGQTTGSGTPALGANCPAVTLTAPNTWLEFYDSGGNVVYVPAWK